MRRHSTIAKRIQHTQHQTIKQTEQTTDRREIDGVKLKRTRKGGFAERCFQKVGFQRRGAPPRSATKVERAGQTPPLSKHPLRKTPFFDTPLHKTPSCRVVEKGDRASSSQLHNVGRHSTVTWGALWDQKVCIMLVSAQGQTHMAPQAPSAKS